MKLVSEANEDDCWQTPEHLQFLCRLFVYVLIIFMRAVVRRLQGSSRNLPYPERERLRDEPYINL